MKLEGVPRNKKDAVEGNEYLEHHAAMHPAAAESEFLEDSGSEESGEAREIDIPDEVMRNFVKSSQLLF